MRYFLIALLLFSSFLSFSQSIDLKDPIFQFRHRQGSFQEYDHVIPKIADSLYLKNSFQELEPDSSTQFVNPGRSYVVESNIQEMQLLGGAATSDKLISSRIDQTLNLTTDQFENQKIEKTIYDDQGGVYVYNIHADSNGDFTDTISGTYSYFPADLTKRIYRNYQKIGDKLRIVSESTGYTSFEYETKCFGTKTSGNYANSYSADFQFDLDGYYLIQEHLTLRSADTSRNQRISYFPDGKRWSESKSMFIGQICSFDSTIYYDETGERTSGHRISNDYQSDKHLSYKQEIWDAVKGEWLIQRYENYTYNLKGNLIAEEFGESTPLILYEYIYDSDTIISKMSSQWDLDMNIWENVTKSTYTYLSDTTMEENFEWDGSNWLLVGKNWFIYWVDSNDNKWEVKGAGELGAEPYELLDTLKNKDLPYSKFYHASYKWNGSDYDLDLYEKIEYEDCMLTIQSSAKQGYGSKEEYFYEDPYMPTSRTGSISYTLSNPDISKGISWDISYMHKTFLFDDGEKSIGVGNMAYFGGTYPNGYKNVIIGEEPNNRIKYEESYRTYDENPENGIDWWQNGITDWFYNDSGERIRIIVKSRNSESDQLVVSGVYSYTHNQFGLEREVYERYNTDTGELFYSDTTSNTYDNEGYLIENLRISVNAEGAIREGRKTIFEYIDAPEFEDCNVEIVGDTIIRDESVILSAKVSLQNLNFKWSNSEGKILSSEPNVEISSGGDYFISISSNNCAISDSIRILNMCPLDIQGDTIISEGSIEIDVKMDGKNSQFLWLNEKDETLSNEPNITIDHGGIFYVEGYSAYCYGYDSLSIWELSQIIVSGDTVLQGPYTELIAKMDQDLAKYQWWDESGNLLSINDTLQTELSGIYYVEAKADYFFASDSITVYAICDYEILGDTLIDNKTSIELVANVIANDPIYNWSNSINHQLSSGPTLQVDSVGIYFLKVLADYCIVDDSIKIWNNCPIKISGDSIMVGKEAKFRGDVAVQMPIQYFWYNESSELIGEQKEIIVDEPGKYILKSKGEYCVGNHQWIVQKITSIDDSDQDTMNIKIFPNPATGSVFLLTELDKVNNLMIFDINGILIKKATPSFNGYHSVIDLDDLVPGNYLLQLESGGNMYKKKLIVK